MIIFLLFALTILCSGTSLSMCVFLRFVELFQHTSLDIVLHIILIDFLLSKGCSEDTHLRRYQSLWESDLKDNEDVAEFEWFFVERKSLTLKSLQHSGLDDLTRLAFNIQFSSVEVQKLEIHSEECVSQGNSLLI